MNGQRCDFTASQFGGEIHYTDTSSDRKEAFSDTNDLQYNHLKKRTLDQLAKGK
ncbi:hypothetical protein J2S17_003311 [Cytobacillus purgationiresistens]|uniref:Uncharacterized protein n=1 Tax=Cytobacillus purgationiresistens TaxID=863449 RepID=A0ABU0AJI8_9BACI|nr:hypothetical protein [Cytobacillus purgationiresistens]MDQ0271423.1 hypothetical protein [Cytobacillus purgationiresistens]